MFTTLVPDVAKTRSAKGDWEKEIQSYRPMPRDYRLNIEMYKYNGTEPIKVGDAVTYKRLDTAVDDEETGQRPQAYDGTLQPEGSEKLYWHDNVSKWGFKATAGSDHLASDQSSQAKWVKEDKLIGYSYLPIWEGTDNDGQPKDDINAINYRTPHEWYVDNQAAQSQSGLMSPEGSNGSEYKKIPLFMQHERAWITIVLRAAEGVTREALAYSTSAQNIQTTIFSYADGAAVNKVDVTKPWSREAFVDYEKDKNGEAATHVSTTRYDAIIEPTNFTTMLESPIATIDLSGQKFHFYSANDKLYIDNIANTSSDGYKNWLKNYNLESGKHLTIEVTLSRETRKILITSWIEDWTEAITSTICDDYGNDGDPVIITSKKGLLQFLMGSDNTPGTVAIIQPKSINLDEFGKWPTYDNSADENEPKTITGDLSTLKLKATLNMAGSTIKGSTQFINSIAESGGIINGTFELKTGTTVQTAIANTSAGSLERITVTKAEGATDVKATVAGFVGTNNGTIYNCSSDVPVYGPSGTDYVGGIAAKNLYSNGVMPIIDNCMVNASVNGASGVKGGGIVGQAEGRITNNVFEYGITISQTSNFKNIFGEQSSNLRAYNNGWPTTAKNPINTDETNVNIYADQYDAVIDCENDLKTLLTSTYNIKNKKYRISDSFTVNRDTWVDNSNKAIGKSDDDYNATTNGNVHFKLYGNDKTITLTGTNTKVELWDGVKKGEGDKKDNIVTAPMLFTNIIGEVHDLNLYLDKPLVAEPSMNQEGTSYSGTDAIAPLAYSIYGTEALISNVSVKAADGAYIQAATPAGLVVWAHGGNDETKKYPTIENCVVDADVRMWLPYTWNQTSSRQYAGGIVCMASIAKVTQCRYITQSSTTLTGAVKNEDFKTEQDIYPANKSNCYYGGIVGGTTYKDNAARKKAELVITDCSSWYNIDVVCSRGGIIGFVLYSEGANSTLFNGMAEGNTGNWWAGTRGIGHHESNPKEDKAIGTKNSVEPQRK